MQLALFGLAATAAALVILPELSDPDESMFRTLPHVDKVSSRPIFEDAHVVSVPCAQCDGANRNLRLGFRVVDGTRLLVNGLELYPRAERAMASKVNSQRLGYSLSVVRQSVGAGAAAAKMQLLDVELRVLEVGDRFVEGVPAVNVKLFRGLHEEMKIADVAVAASRFSGCHSMACRAKEGMADAWRALKEVRPLRGCHGRGRGRGRGRGQHHSQTSALLQSGSGDRFPQIHEQEWRPLLTHIAAQIFLPVLMGMTAGVGVALLAMAVCSLFCRLAASVRGKRTMTIANEEDTSFEKARLMDPAELPPQYEDGKA
ncbi:hypothetical protein E4U13_007329 [Claviceps humidiphila]|uniref:DUF7728 domain-containing protein n=1 Tax=Claviceps humidiphila TaxID=1294629 RepID=A0A9P7TRI8_9HYPO|nr:hypothetical protein E4U13_007329 [Claviceps humidiphila]